MAKITIELEKGDIVELPADYRIARNPVGGLVQPYAILLNEREMALALYNPNSKSFFPMIVERVEELVLVAEAKDLKYIDNKAQGIFDAFRLSFGLKPYFPMTIQE